MEHICSILIRGGRMSINYIDLFILILMIVSVYFGFKKGFLKTIIGVLSIVISLIIAVTLYQPVEGFIKNTVVYEYVYDNVNTQLETPDEETNLISEYGAGKLNLPRSFLKTMQNKVNDTQESVSDTIAIFSAESAVKIISMLLVFLAARLLILVISAVAGLLKKLPLIGWSDRILGILFGFVRGFLIVYLILAVITVSAQIKSDNFAARAVKQSEFAKIMYNNNVFLDFIHKD